MAQSFRAECLNAHWFLTLDDARSKLEECRRYYNEERPTARSGTYSPLRAQSRWRAQRTVVTKPENSSLRRSKEWSLSTPIKVQLECGLAKLNLLTSSLLVIL
jgi:hypothetical protein